MNDKKKLRKRKIEAHLSEEEFKIFNEDAELYDMSHAEYIRWSLFNRSVTFKVKNEKPIEAYKEYLQSLGQIGNNVNQIARYLNSGGTLTTSIQEEIRKLISDTMLINKDIEKLLRQDSESDEKVYEIK